MNTEQDIALMKKDIQCHTNKLTKFEDDFNKRGPAKETYGAINNFTLEITRMQDRQKVTNDKVDGLVSEINGLKNLINKFIESADEKYTPDKDNEKMHGEIMKRVSRLEWAILTVLVGAIYVIAKAVLGQVGLNF